MNKKRYQRVVVKIGSHLIFAGKDDFVNAIASQVKNLKDRGVETIIVSSGAIVSGVEEYGLKVKPTNIVEKQAYAAVGQPLLMNKYITAFKKHGLKIAQVLLTREDFDSRQRYVNIKNTLNYLLKIGCIPIINENDTVATEEIKLGDNDTLSAIVATKLDADLLILLTDVDGVFDKDPNLYPDAKILQEIKDIEEIEQKFKFGTKSEFFCGTGGVKTKIDAAKICVVNGVEVVIANGNKENVIMKIINKEPIGSRFLPKQDKNTISSREKWIAFVSKPKGKIYVDEGASEAIVKKRKSLLPVGIKKIEGKFNKGDVVSICLLNGEEIARGVVNYPNEVIDKIKGQRTYKTNFKDIKEVIHTDNIVITKKTTI
ncbi:MAG: glutamate 5-kinase [Endomicrobia bacterium]|nr:glutamate 5-kinase [Endomicrobiia bacterium]